MDDEVRRKRYWFNEPWQDADSGRRLAAMELGSQIIFVDRSAVKFDGNGWVKDERYQIEAAGETEADRFLEGLNETAAAADRR
jgi:hypothetical protein